MSDEDFRGLSLQDQGQWCVRAISQILDSHTFSQLVDEFSLNSKPTEHFGALLAWLIFDPTPSEVFPYLPVPLYTQEVRKYIPSYGLGLTPFREASLPNDLLSLGNPMSPVTFGDRMTVLYPPVPGRAGAKTNVTPFEMYLALKGDEITWPMAKTLLSAQNDWEATVAASLLGLHRASRESYRYSLLFLANRGCFT